MKQFLVINALAAILAIGSLADARLVSTRAQCVAACGNATTQTCGCHGCLIDTGVGVGSDYGFSAGVGATWFFEGTCPTVYCYVEATGLVYWN